MAARKLQERGRARLLLITIGLAAVLPLAMKRVRLQPYPALLMPSFAGRPLRSGEITWRETRIVAVTDDDTHINVDAEQLLPGVQVNPFAVLSSALLAGLDAGGKPLQRPHRASLLRRLLKGLPQGMTIRGTMRAFDARTATWLNARLSELLPGQRIAYVQLIVEKRRASSQRLDVIDVEVVQVVTLPLLGPP